MKKLIVIDLDGTLLDSDAQISQENKDAIKAAKEKGAKVIIASGRMQKAIKTYAQEIGADKYIICGNGASIYDIEKDEQIYKNFVPKEKALKIIELCEKNSIYYSVYTENSIICNSLKYSALVYNSENANKEENKRTNISIVEDIYEYIDKINTQNILKINVSDDNKTIFDSTLKTMHGIPNIEILTNTEAVRRQIKNGTQRIDLEYYYADISSKNVNKWTAVQQVMKKFRIAKKDVIAIGDNTNDKMMIENAGVGLIMGSGSLVTRNKKRQNNKRKQ